MKKDLLLVLCFYEGQGFFPKEGHRVVLSAKIDNNILSTDPVVQTSEPKFCTEISWTVDHQTLRRYKLSRVPVKVECFSLDKNDDRNCLGYIILTLSSVVQGIETDPKWYKLLGGNLQQSKIPPQLLLSLNLHPVNLDDEQVKVDSPRMLHNGNMHGGQYTLTPVSSAVNNHLSQHNGTSHVYQVPNMNSHVSLSHQDAFPTVDFGASSKLGALLSDRSSQMLISSSQKDAFQMLSSDSEIRNKDTGSAKHFEDEFSQAEHIDFDEEQDDDLCKIEDVYTEENLDGDLAPSEDIRDAQEVRAKRFETASADRVKNKDFTKCNGRVEFRNIKSKSVPSSPVERVRSLLDGVTSGGESLNESENKLKKKEKFDDDVDIYSGLDDEGLDSGFQSRFSGKAREGWPSAQPVYHSSGEGEKNIAGSSSCPKSAKQNKFEHRRLSDPLSSALSGSKRNFIPVRNKGGLQGSAQSSATRQNSGHSDHLVPHMDHDGGFIQIGPAGDPEEESFEFAVTIVSAKNLDQLLPKDFTWNPATETCFSYSLMGSMITSDPIKSLSHPEFLAERVAGNIQATSSNLSAYFKKNPVFPIHLIVGDLCLASASISLMKFQDFESRAISQVPLTLEGWHQMVSVAPEPREFIPGKEPVIGVVFQLSGQSQRNVHYMPSLLSNSDGSSESEIDMYDYPVSHRRRHRPGKLKFHNLLDSPSLSSESSEEDILPAGKRRRGGNSRKFHLNKPSLTDIAALQGLSDEGGKLRRHLVKAALEVESWKVDQQAMFLKQWAQKEAELQRHLSEEWKARINYKESSLHNRLAQIDGLNRKLTSALSELSIREKKLSAKEDRVHKLLEDLETQKKEQDGIEKETFEGRLKQKERKENDALLEELKREKEKNEELENEVCELKSMLNDSELSPNQQYQEMRKQIISLKKDRDILSDELATTIKKKQYYKVQWVRSVSELHHFKKSHLHDVEALRCEMEMSSPEPLFPHPQHHKSRFRSHNIDGSQRKTKLSSKSCKSGKGSESLYSVKSALDSQRLKERVNVEPGCSWMDQSPNRETGNRIEPKVSGLPRNRTEAERTIDIGKVRRTSMGNSGDFEEFVRRKSNDDQLERMLKECVWKVGD
ncbi:centrosomal protein of 120 kDa-like isoform X2 [Palaemon carinicauda]|uniref:centrosomal protein of 120 kDa-like isoform X2 n=1 Tax=Palaemon carinicauda TaxID=392227 RepID=UPI0035B686E5